MQSLDEREDAFTGINVTPMVDVVLVMLIIFMAAAPMIVRRTLKIDLPKATRHEKTGAAALAVALDAAGQMTLSGKLVSAAELQQALVLAVTADAEQAVMVSADRALPYGEVATLLDDIRGAGVRKVGLEVFQK